MIADTVDVECVIVDEVAFAVFWSRPLQVEDFLFVGLAIRSHPTMMKSSEGQLRNSTAPRRAPIIP